MKRIYFASAAPLLALLLAAGCGSVLGTPGGGGYPSYPASPGPYPNQSNSTMQGVVTNVDTRAQRIDLNVDEINGRSNNPYQTSIYYDTRTQVLYNGQTYSPSNLERGDRIDVSMYYNNGQSVADSITVVQDVRSQGNYPYPSSTYPPPNNYPPPQSTYPNQNEPDIQGTVNYVDTTAQRIDLTSAYATNLRNSGNGSGNYSIYYSSNTPVYWNGQTYRPSDLERGDQVDVRVFNNGNSQYQADTITVTRNVRQ